MFGFIYVKLLFCRNNDWSFEIFVSVVGIVLLRELKFKFIRNSFM